jgi:hypothetical protein
MIYKIALIFLATIFVFSCETNPPNALEPTDEYGKVFVSSNVDSAEIFVDNLTSGRFTPDTLELKIGSHNISLSKNGYSSSSESITIKKDSLHTIKISLAEEVDRKVLLIEDFSNVSCDPCVVSNKILKALNSSYGHSKLVVIKYAANFPSASDPMYLANPSDAKSRMNFYSIMFTPTVIIDGVDRPISSDSNSIKEQINKNLLESSKFEITVKKNIIGETIKVSGNLKLFDKTDLDFSNLVLHSVVIESMIEYQTPPGSNGETEFEDVMRKMLPNNQGYSITNIENSNEISFSFEAEVNSNWHKDKLEVVLFIQDVSSKKVYQAVLAK